MLHLDPQKVEAHVRALRGNFRTRDRDRGADDRLAFFERLADRVLPRRLVVLLSECGGGEAEEEWYGEVAHWALLYTSPHRYRQDLGLYATASISTSMSGLANFASTVVRAGL